MALVAFPATAAADPEPTVVVKEDVSVMLPGCGGDVVTLTGEVTVVDHISLDEQGGSHEKFGIEMRGFKGVGVPSGKNYTGVETVENEIQIPRGATEATFESTHSLIRQGDTGLAIVGDDLHLKAVSHFTIPVGGGVPIYTPKFSVECR